MSRFNRCVLAHALLDGDWDARWVLADLLSESGDDELAAFARTSRRINLEGDLDLAVRLVPSREAIALGCAMLDRGMTGKGTIRRHAWLLARLARIRRLVRKKAEPQQLAAEGLALADYQAVASAGRDDHYLQEAARSLGLALEHIETQSAVGLAVTSLARSVRCNGRSGYLEELEWQVQRTQQMLAKLIDEEQDDLATEPTDAEFV
jgi:hypothetical protein